MEKSAGTYIEKLGFKDPDLTTPGHDALMLWSCENAEKIGRDLFKDTLSKKAKKDYDACVEKSNNFLKDKSKKNQFLHVVDTFYNEYPFSFNFSLDVSKWEYPILRESYGSKNPFIVGYIDLVCKYSYSYPELCFHGYDYSEIGYDTSVRKNITVNYEIKTKIPSIGELIRQINTYKTFREGYYCVISPKDDFKKTLAQQGIFSYKVSDVSTEVEKKNEEPEVEITSEVLEM